jgi:hypothetical protein
MWPTFHRSEDFFENATLWVDGGVYYCVWGLSIARLDDPRFTKFRAPNNDFMKCYFVYDFNIWLIYRSRTVINKKP